MNLSQAIKEKRRWFMLLFTPHCWDLNPAATRTSVSAANICGYEEVLVHLCVCVWEKGNEVLNVYKMCSGTFCMNIFNIKRKEDRDELCIS